MHYSDNLVAIYCGMNRNLHLILKKKLTDLIANPFIYEEYWNLDHNANISYGLHMERANMSSQKWMQMVYNHSLNRCMWSTHFYLLLHAANA